MIGNNPDVMKFNPSDPDAGEGYIVYQNRKIGYEGFYITLNIVNDTLKHCKPSICRNTRKYRGYQHCGIGKSKLKNRDLHLTKCYLPMSITIYKYR